MARSIVRSPRPGLRRSTPDVVAAPIDRQNLDRTVAALRGVTTQDSLARAVALGEILVLYVYRGRESAWRSRTRDNPTLRVIAAYPELPFGASTLYRALAVRELVLRMGGLEACVGLTAAHVYAVLPMDPSGQIAALERARDEGLTGTQLRKLCANASMRRRGGRRAMFAILRTLRGCDRELRPASEELTTAVSALAPKDANECLELLQRIERSLAAIRRALDDA